MDFLQKLREALSLDAEASEEQVLEAVKTDPVGKVREALGLDESADLQAITDKIVELKDEEPASLAEQADAEGKAVVDKATLADLTRKANAGESAANELKQKKLDTKDETRERLQKLYDVAPEETLDDIANRPKLVSLKAQGDRGQAANGDAPAGVDQEGWELHQRVEAYQREHPDLDYAQALDVVSRQEVAA